MIEQAYQKHRSELLRYARKQVDRSTAEDIVQQAFIDLMECEQVQQVRAFLYRSVTTNIIDFIRSEIYRRSCSLEVARRIEAPWEPMSYVETLTSVRQAIAKLPRYQVVEDVLCDGYSYFEAARRHGITVSHCRQIIHRARKLIQNSKLRNSVEETSCTAMK